MQYRLEIVPELYRGGFLLISVMVGFLMLIVSAGESSLGRFLSARPLVFIGKRAYGLYLWHWPIYIILGITLNNKFQDLYKLLLTFIVAEISYQIVENPIRFNSYKKWTFLKRFLWLILLSTPILFLGVNLTKNYLLDSALVKSKKIDLNETSSIPRLNESKKEYIEAWRQQKCLRELQKVKPISQDVQITIFGDSVMLGAKNEFAKNIVGTEVEAAVGRQGYEGLSIVRDYKSKEKLGKKVLLHYGTNGFLNEKQMRDILSELSDRELVIIMNVYAQRKWQDENNIMLRKLANEYDNTKLFDWHEIVLSNSSLLSGDQVHPNQKGMELIAKEVKQLSSLPGYQEIDQLRRPIPKSCK
jgi:small basic protein